MPQHNAAASKSPERANQHSQDAATADEAKAIQLAKSSTTGGKMETAQKIIDAYDGGSLDLSGCNLTGITLPTSVGGSLDLSRFNHRRKNENSTKNN